VTEGIVLVLIKEDLMMMVIARIIDDKRITFN